MCLRKGVHGGQPLRWQLGTTPTEARESPDNPDTQIPRVLRLPLRGGGEQTQPKACGVGPFSMRWLDEMSGMLSPTTLASN